MKTKLLFFCISLFILFSNSANAANPLGRLFFKAPTDYGNWYCSYCTNLQDYGTLMIFIKSTRITDQYVDGDTFNVCNGGDVCVRFRYFSMQPAPTMQSLTKDNHQYKNVPAKSSSLGGGGVSGIISSYQQSSTGATIIHNTTTLNTGNTGTVTVVYPVSNSSSYTSYSGDVGDGGGYPKTTAVSGPKTE